MKLPRKPKPGPRQAQPPLPPPRPVDLQPQPQAPPPFQGGLADRQPGAPPVVGDVVAARPPPASPPLPPPRPAELQPQAPAAGGQDPMSWMQAVFANPPGGANENVALALQDQAIRSKTAPWMGRDQLAQLLAQTKGG